MALDPGVREAGCASWGAGAGRGESRAGEQSLGYSAGDLWGNGSKQHFTSLVLIRTNQFMDA